MDIMSTAAQNLLSPFTLFFLLGILAGALKSSLTIPETVSKSIGLYLMMAIGYRGGAELAHNRVDGSIVAACLAAVALGFTLPLVAYPLLRWTTRLDSVNAAAVAAHYGSVSAVTFATTIAVLHHRGEPFEPYILALMAVMEAPAILTGLVLARRGSRAEEAHGPGNSLTMTIHEVLLHGSVFLLLGSFVVGWATGNRGFHDLQLVFVKPFEGVLCVFLLEIGLLVAHRASDLRSLSPGLVAFGFYMPLLGAAAGLGVALVLGLSAGGATLLAVLGASASYIVVPAVMRDALPHASPAIYMALALGITFPFNLILGIPLYHSAARAIARPAATSTSPGGAPAVSRQATPLRGSIAAPEPGEAGSRSRQERPPLSGRNGGFPERAPGSPPAVPQYRTDDPTTPPDRTPPAARSHGVPARARHLAGTRPVPPGFRGSGHAVALQRDGVSEARSRHRA